MSRISQLYLILLFLVHSGYVWAQQPEFVDAPLAAKFQEALEQQHEAQIATGFTAAVSLPDGRIWYGVAGMSNPSREEAFRTDHRIGFASITKTFTAALVLQLVEEGLLTLEDTIDDWFPPMTFINGAVTIRQMLNHESGIYNFRNHPDLVPLAQGTPGRFWTPEELLGTFLDRPVFAPGAGSGYSNTNYILLGMIAEVATEENIASQFRSRFLDPHGLTETYLGAEEPATGEVATTWFDLDHDGSLDDNSEFFDATSFHSLRWAAGGMFSIPNEIAQWAKILFASDLLEEETRNEMLTFLPITGTGAVWTGYGLGIQEYWIAEETFWGHSGGLRGAASLMVYSPATDISIAVASNDNRANHVQLVASLFETAKASQLPTSYEEVPSNPEDLLVTSVYPSPFQSRVILNYQLAHHSSVRVRIHDLLGREVFTEVLPEKEAGVHKYEWDGNDANGKTMSPGVYVYTMVTSSGRFAGSIVKSR